MNKKNFNLILLIAAAVFAVVAIVLLVVGITYDADHIFTKVMVFVVAGLSLALAAELVYLRFISEDRQPNFFLYDSKSKKNMPLEALTFAVVNNRMNRFFANYASSEGKIWTEGILDNPQLDMPDEFKPLVAYKLLFNIAHTNVDGGWKCFEVSSIQTVEFICKGLEQNGDKELAKNLRMMKSAQPFQISYVKEYLVNNKAYLQSKMLRYVRENIAKFQ